MLFVPLRDCNRGAQKLVFTFIDTPCRSSGKWFLSLLALLFAADHWRSWNIFTLLVYRTSFKFFRCMAKWQYDPSPLDNNSDDFPTQISKLLSSESTVHRPVFQGLLHIEILLNYFQFWVILMPKYSSRLFFSLFTIYSELDTCCKFKILNKLISSLKGTDNHSKLELRWACQWKDCVV